MFDIEIYGVMNEDREIIWINIHQPVEWNNMGIEEDAVWKGIIKDNKELNDILAYAKWDKDFIILERISEDISDEELSSKVIKWINIFNPKYNDNEFILYKPEDVMEFIIKKEAEWEEEDKKQFKHEFK